MREEAEGVEPVVDGDDYDVGGLVYPVLKGPVGGVAVDVTWLESQTLEDWEGKSYTNLRRECRTVRALVTKEFGKIDAANNNSPSRLLSDVALTGTYTFTFKQSSVPAPPASPWPILPCTQNSG